MKHFFAICIVALMLSAQAQLPSYVPTEDLVAWYPFNGNANDESGYQNHGVVVGATLTMDRFGNENGAYHFDGSDHIEADHQSWLNSGLGSKTWAGWGRKTSGNDHAHFMTKCVATSGPYTAEATYLRFGPTNEIEFAEGQSWIGGNSVWTVVGSVLNEWVHLVGVKDVDSGNVRIYLNGVFMGEEQIQFPELEADNEGLLFIGCEHPYVSLPSGPQYFYGDLDELGIWNRALTEEEILSLYLSESVVQGCMEPMSCNFNPEAEEDDGSCEYSCCPGPGCCDVGMHWDWELGMCQITNVADTNLDGCVQLNDLLDVLSAYGDCGAEEEVTEHPCSGGAFSPGDDLACAGWNYLGAYDGGEYYVSSFPLAWDSAQAFALELNGGLAVISSQEENDWISNLVGDTYVWIGLYQDLNSTLYSEPDGGWLWVDGSSVDFENWAATEPNNDPSNLSESCQMYSSGLWNDAPGDDFIDGSDGRDIFAVIEFR